MLTVAAAVFLGWIWSGRLLAKRHKWEMGQALGIDATLYLPALVATATLLLLRYDIRFRPDSPVKVEFFFGLVAMLILPRLLAWASQRSQPHLCFRPGRDGVDGPAKTAFGLRSASSFSPLIRNAVAWSNHFPP